MELSVKVLLDIPPWEWPRGAGEVILKTLVDKQAEESDRVLAAELAGDLMVMNNRMADALLAVVGSSDEPEELRGTAAIALGPVLEQADVECLDSNQFDDPEAVPITILTFRNLQESLHKFYLDERHPKEVRRRILEAAVRAPQDWHSSAIQAAYTSGDDDWKLTAVFAMHCIRGFDEQILESLDSPNPQIHLQAVRAAGAWGLDAAWPYLAALVTNSRTPKNLRLAAIEGVGNIRPQEAEGILVELTDSPDEDIAEAATEALAMAEGISGKEDDDEDEEDDPEWVN